jgi:hypothetical protein
MVCQSGGKVDTPQRGVEYPKWNIDCGCAHEAILQVHEVRRICKRSIRFFGKNIPESQWDILITVRVIVHHNIILLDSE